MSLFFATYIKCDEENRHVVKLGTKYPVVYLVDECHQIFKREKNGSLTELTADDHAKKPWIKKNLFREIRNTYASRMASMNAEKRKQNRFFA